MVNPAILVPTVIANLPTNAPEIIREINPATWVERIIHDGRQYKLARQQIQVMAARDKMVYAQNIKSLEVQLEKYKISLAHEGTVFNQVSKDIVKSYKISMRTVANVHKQSSKMLSDIMKNAGVMDKEVLKILLDHHKSLTNSMLEAVKHFDKNVSTRHSMIIDKATTAKSFFRDFGK